MLHLRCGRGDGMCLAFDILYNTIDYSEESEMKWGTVRSIA